MDDIDVTPEDFDVTVSGGDDDDDRDLTDAEARASWRRIEAGLAERPVDRAGLARLAGALAARLETTGDAAEISAARHLAASIRQVTV